MRFIRELYCGETAQKKARKIRRKLLSGAGMLNVYCIAVPQAGNDLLEIYHSSMMQQAFLRKNILIAGIACGYNEAVKVVQRILEDTIAETGGMDVRKFLEGKQRKYILIGHTIKVEGTAETQEGDQEE